MSGFGWSILIICGMCWIRARRWRYLAKSYAADSDDPIEFRRMQTLVLNGFVNYGHSFFRGNSVLKGIVTIGAHPLGVSLKVMWPFALFHNPLFIPYSEISGWDTSWYLNAQSTELHFLKAPDVQLTIPTEDLEWLAGYAGGTMTLSTEKAPRRTADRGIYYAAMFCNVVLVGAAGAILFTALSLIPG